MVSINLNSATASSGTGIDVTAVVDQILYAERAPERLWQAQQVTLTTQTGALNNINSYLSALEDKINALKDFSGAITAKVATSAQPGVFTATAQSSAVPGNHIVVVNNLASISSYYSDAVNSSTTPLNQGTFSLQVGSGQAVPIPVDSTNNTLDGLASYINTQNLGVSASVISDANGSRLALVSQASGAPGDLTITGNTTGLVFNKSVTGRNAALSIDGVPVSSTNNTVVGALAGVTLNLLSASPGTEVQLSVAPDVTGAKQAVNDFVGAYNTITGAINAQFTVDSTTHLEGPLGSNGALRSLQASLLSDVTYSISGNNGFGSLASLGISMNNDGTLTVDSTTLDSVLAGHFSEFQNLLQSLHPDGFASHFSTDLMGLTDATSGFINLNLNEISTTQTMLSHTITDFEDRLATRQQQLITQYSQVDTMLRQFPLIMAQITGQLGTLQQK